MITHFNNSQFRRYIVAFGSLFNNIAVARKDANEAEVQRLVVPLDYGPKERWLRRLVQDPELTRSVAIIFPRMTYSLEAVTYDASRHLQTLNTLQFTDETSNNHLTKQYVSVPYNMTFNLSIGVKFLQDSFQIVEQILPYFTPDLTFAMNPVPELPTLVDQVPLTLSSITHSDNYEGDFERRRAVIWDMTFIMKGNFYGPKRRQSRINEVMVDIHMPYDLEDIDVDDEQIVRIISTADPLEGQEPTDEGYVTANTTITRSTP